MSKIAGDYMYHKKFSWISTRIDYSQDNMVPAVDSNISSINECLNAESDFASDSNPPSDKPLSSETQSEMVSQPAADVPLDFSVRNSNNAKQPQDESNESKERIEFFRKTPKSEPEDFSTSDKALDKNMYNGNSSPGHINGRSQFSTPSLNSMDGFSSASHNSDIRLQNSPTHLENGRGIHSVPGAYFTPKNGQRINTHRYEPFLQTRYMEHYEQLKISTENGKEVNGVNFHEGEPSSSPTRSSSLSLESSPPHRNSSSILEEVLVGKQGEKSHFHGMYPFAQNHNLHDNTKPVQLTHSTPNSNMNLSTWHPGTSTEVNRREALPLSNANTAAALGFATPVSPLDVNPILPGINPLMPMNNPLISPTSFPLHNALASGTLNGMHPYLMSSLNSRLPQIGSGGDRKSGKPIRPFKALAGELLFGMAQRVPMSHALYPGYNVTGFTNGSPDPPRSNIAPKKEEVPRESEKSALNIASNQETQYAAGTSNSNDSNGSHNEVNGCNTEAADSSNSANRKRSRLPDDQKDDAYWERRRKNNEAAKRSRDARRVKEDMITHTACALSQENIKLSINMRRLQEDNGNLLLQIKSLVEEKQRMDVRMQLLKSELMSMMCWKCGSRYSEGHDKNGD